MFFTNFLLEASELSSSVSTDISEISDLISSGFTNVLDTFKDIIVMAIKFGFPIVGVFIVVSAAVKIFKIITKDSEYEEAFNSQKADTDQFLSEYEDWLNDHPTY